MSMGKCQAFEEGLRALANWANALSFDSIPNDVVKRAALVVMDDLACAVGSRDVAEMQALKMHLPTGVREATVFLGGTEKTDRASASRINAVASNWCQLDEGHRQVMCHAGLYVVPAAIAEAEATGATILDLLKATIISYEIVCRFAQTFRFSRPTVHPHAMWSALGAATAVGVLRRFGAVQLANVMLNAVTIATPGPFHHAVAGAPIVNAWAGIGVANGFHCADLAECGVWSLASSPFEVFVSIFGAEIDTGALANDLGEYWALRDNYHKVHSCAQQSNAAAEATLQLKQRWPAGKTPADITQIVVEGHALTLSMNNRNPPTSLAARFSVPHIVATVCVTGRTDANAFSDTTLDDNNIRRLRSLVELRLHEPLPPPHDRAARVTLKFDDGRLLVEDCLSAEGGPDRPFPPHIILEKCATMTKSVYPNFGASAARFYCCDTKLLDELCANFIQNQLCTIG